MPWGKEKPVASKQPKAIVNKSVVLSAEDVARIIQEHLRDTLNDKHMMIVPTNIHVQLTDRTKTIDQVKVSWQEKVWV